MIKEEILTTINSLGMEKLKQRVFDGFQIGEDEVETIFTSISSGHHILILGPPGSGKTEMANRIASILSNDIEVVKGCPLNCSPQDASCPWCLDKKYQNILLKGEILHASERIKRVQGSGGLVAEDLTGDLDPEAAFIRGIYSPAAFVPGKLLRANKGVLLIDFIDRVPERVLNAILYALQGEEISIGAFEESIPLDILVIATGSEKALKYLPLDIIDFFDVVKLDYIDEHDAQKQIIFDNVEDYLDEKAISESIVDKAIEIIDQTRQHPEVERGVSTRGMIKYSEILASYSHFKPCEEKELLKKGSSVSLPHRLGLTPETELPGKREQIVNEIVNKVTRTKETENELVALSKEDILALVEEIVREEKIRKPLKYGAFDILLKRVQRFPESKLAQIYRERVKRLQRLYPERYKMDNLTDSLLTEIEEERKKAERIKKVLEEDALFETLKFLEEQDIVERNTTGWTLSQRGITYLLERLTPRLDEGLQFYGYGKHSAGKKLTLGEGKVVGSRHFRFGDRYRDVSFRDTVREALHNRRQVITREDIMVNVKDIHTKLNIVLLLDLSGTMRQLQKLWYAKESGIALALAAARYGDNVGVISFSNLADIVVDLTSNPYRVTKQMLDLELHENAFTNIGYGILKTCDLLAHHPKGKAKQHIILISDGDATAPHPSPERFALRQAATAARRGITISCVCIAQESSNPELMRRIAKIGKGRIYLVGAEELTTALLEETTTLHAF